MKKRLLGVTALCMIGLLAGLALAQEGGREDAGSEQPAGNASSSAEIAGLGPIAGRRCTRS